IISQRLKLSCVGYCPGFQDPSIYPRRFKTSCVGYCPGFQDPSYPLIDSSLGKSISVIYIA
nr:hypothetical protein [Tanacetum cinerariifolium]